MQTYYMKTTKNSTPIPVEVEDDIYEFLSIEDKRLEDKLTKSDQRHILDIISLEDVLSTYENAVFMTEEIEYNEFLAEANKILEKCTKKQQRRFHLNKILGYSLTDIAKMENCKKQSVKESVKSVCAKLTKIKNF